ncbi:MBL fold metallo-hydrolase [Adlercreutzia mucosicola]|uniref:MBL fold metallo-hydrolase n=1 Tax=Adlercreutzia mucosicola TaxID=580026 RepID=UPI0003FF9702|nr:MBL fold metallo-hydrolase [Adlercreutzia mucosicola]MCR2034171.1 MBL fold metallo-hydrolase [Adlercreutzia mucosicola]
MSYGVLSAGKRGRLCALAIVIALGAMLLAVMPVAAHAATAGTVRIHVLPFDNTDAILVECDGRFGMVDSGEDSSYPDGSDSRYPARPGITRGQGIEHAVIAYMKSLGVNADNFDFYIGTHTHSDHIGSASDIIRTFQPRTVYTPYYSDLLISDGSRLWDNLYVYDRLCAAVESYDGRLVHYLDPAWEEPGEGDGPDGGAGDDLDGGDGDGDLDGDDDPRADHTGSPYLTLGSAAVEILNYDDANTDYIAYRVPDANFFSYGVKVTAPNGRIAFLAGDINNYANDWTVGNGDEAKLARTLRNVDFLKLGHHGHVGSNTPAYLRAILRPVVGNVRPVAVQTGAYQLMPAETVQALHRLGVRHFNATYAAQLGQSAFVATLGDKGVTTNVDGNRWIQQQRNAAPWAFFYNNGVPLTNKSGWVAINGTWYFLEPGGAVAMGWKDVGGTWYHLDWSDGSMNTGWLHEGASHYYLNGDGSMHVGAGWERIGNAWYYYADQSGAVKTGWLQDGQSWYYLDPDSGAMATGWVEVGGTWYYLNGSGVMQTGWQQIGDTWYYLNGSGAMATGWLAVGGTWYYFHDSGAMATGWAQVDGTWYYLSGSGAMLTGWQSIGGAWYYLDGSGAMATGWLAVGGTWYYFHDSGAMATGWVEVGGTWYYLKGSGAMATGWQSIGGTWYYLDGSGAMATGWLAVGGTWYYFHDSGAMATGWVEVDGTWYYLRDSGAMAAECWVGNYYLLESGAMATDQWIGECYVGSDGLWDATR